MTLRLTEEETEILRKTAERENRSMQEVARLAIVEYATRRNELRDKAIARIVAENAELLDRLGRA